MALGLQALPHVGLRTFFFQSVEVSRQVSHKVSRPRGVFWGAIWRFSGIDIDMLRYHEVPTIYTHFDTLRASRGGKITSFVAQHHDKFGVPPSVTPSVPPSVPFRGHFWSPDYYYGAFKRPKSGLWACRRFNMCASGPSFSKEPKCHAKCHTKCHAPGGCFGVRSGAFLALTLICCAITKYPLFTRILTLSEQAVEEK